MRRNNIFHEHAEHRPPSQSIRGLEIYIWCARLSVNISTTSLSGKYYEKNLARADDKSEADNYQGNMSAIRAENCSKWKNSPRWSGRPRRKMLSKLVEEWERKEKKEGEEEPERCLIIISAHAISSRNFLLRTLSTFLVLNGKLRFAHKTCPPVKWKRKVKGKCRRRCCHGVRAKEQTESALDNEMSNSDMCLEDSWRLLSVASYRFIFPFFHPLRFMLGLVTFSHTI